MKTVLDRPILWPPPEDYRFSLSDDPKLRLRNITLVMPNLGQVLVILVEDKPPQSMRLHQQILFYPCGCTSLGEVQCFNLDNRDWKGGAA